MKIVYSKLCPVCGKQLTPEEIYLQKCLVTGKPLVAPFEVKDLPELEKIFGKPLSSLQKMRAKRALKGESFVMEAPTWSGKSTLGLALAIWFASKGKKAYIIVPTVTLVKQTYSRLVEGEFGKIVKQLWIKVVAYHWDLKNKDQVLEQIKAGDFDILITTANFLINHFKDIRHHRFGFVFVDDLDAVLRGSKNIDKILWLLGIKNPDNPPRYHWILVVATATSKPWPALQKLKNALGLDASFSKVAFRNIVDVAWATDNKFEALDQAVEILQDGILVFTPTQEEANQVLEFLKQKGYKAWTEKDLDQFAEGAVNILVGVAAPYWKLVRGLDLPLRVKFAVFFGAPWFKLKLDPANLWQEDGKPNEKFIGFLLYAFKNHPKIAEEYLLLRDNPEQAAKILEEILTSWEDLNQFAAEDVVIEDGHIWIGDIKTYIQASWRTSRFFWGGFTKGLSLLLDSQPKVDAFVFRASFFDIEFVPFDKKQVEELAKQIHTERQKLAQKPWEFKDLLKPAVMVVESPTKAKQISRFWWKPSVRLFGEQVFYEIFAWKFVLLITASLGHVVDLLTKKCKYGICMDEDIQLWYGTIKRCPQEQIQFVDEDKKCQEVKDAKTIIDNVRQNCYITENLIVATDPDVEGEKIAYDLASLNSFANVHRAEFHEITKPAVQKALEELRGIDQNLVGAQLVRRVEDRLVGFELSQVVQKKFGKKNLSAWRVQTPVLGWIIEAWRESQKTKKVAWLVLSEGEVKLELPKVVAEGKAKVKIELGATDVLEKVPLPPYTTDEVLNDANRILGWWVDRTMAVLQKLFENGLITYHRTDSTYVSPKWMAIAKMFLKDEFVGRSRAAEGAHEAIRPTRALKASDLWFAIKEGNIKVVEEITKDDIKLYDLIFGRFMASQAKPVEVVEGVYKIEVLQPENLEFEQKEVVEARWIAYKLYPYWINVLRLPEGELEALIKIEEMPLRYPLTQAEAIKMMKERWIGRPSTYAITIQKLLQRKYVVPKGRFLIPTELGIKVYEFLSQNFKKFVSEEATRRIYQLMDEVQAWKRKPEEVIRMIWDELYG